MAVHGQGEDDVLVGLEFELTGGLGRMAGRIVGKANGLYLVQREGADHFELMDVDDLRGARFFKAGTARAPAGAAAEALAVNRGLLAAKRQAEATSAPGPGAPQPAAKAAGDPAAEPAEGGQRRLGDQIRKAVARRTES